jgi:retron-type reverse transcriptase
VGRVGDRRVLALVKAFLKAGILTELGEERDTPTGTPQGGILSPLLANIALSVLDEHVHAPRRSHVHLHAPQLSLAWGLSCRELELRHRRRARAEDRIRSAKDTA